MPLIPTKHHAKVWHRDSVSIDRVRVNVRRAWAIDQVRDDLVKFKPYLPLITALRNEGMRDRHWKQVTTKLGKTVSPMMGK